MKHPQRFYSTAGLMLALVGLLAFIVKQLPLQLAQNFDTPIQNFFINHRPSWSPFFLTITKIGNPTVIVPIFLLVVVGLTLKKYYAESVWVTVSFLAISGIVNPLIKLLMARSRPDLVHLVIEKSYSFPSGHASASMIILGCFIFFAHRLIKNLVARRLLQLVLGLLILLIGCSRIYLGVHYPSDILAGWSLSLAFLLASFPTYQKICFKWLKENKQK